MVRSQYTTLQCIASFGTRDLSDDKRVAEGSVLMAYLLEQEENELEEVLTGEAGDMLEKQKRPRRLQTLK